MASNNFTGTNIGGIQAGHVHVAGDVHVSHGCNTSPDVYACLRSLNYKGMYEEVDTKDRVPGTGDWIFDHRQYRARYENGGTLHISGRAGCGKSMLMHHIVAEASKPSSPEKSILLWFCFGHANDSRSRPELNVLKSLLHQLLSLHDELLAEYVQLTGYAKRCRSRGTPGVDWDWPTQELGDQLNHMLRKAASNGYEVRIFLDGLDEAGKDVAKRLLDIFRKLSGAVSVCFSARPQAASEPVHNFRIYLADENYSDIELYLDHHFSNIGLDWPHLITIKVYLMMHSSGVFQWLAWICPRVVKLARSQQR
ncbi:hypothetical protein LTR10_000024 [Elasticomyces elasticus]|nr:hypothetical protein LTR10_000024 [Elasticomyces elasticus]KAK4980718.1 hypothetical protein LTR42_001027 [Elasticomyces elasticus]